MTKDTNGAALVGRILAVVASEPAQNAAALVVRLGGSRATTFDVLRRLEAAGLIERDARGIISPGPLAAKNGHAVFGLAPLAGAAEALLPALRDDTEAQVELVVGDERLTLVRRDPPASVPDRLGVCIEAPVAATSALVRVRLGSGAAESEKHAARLSANAVAAALSSRLLSPRERGKEAPDLLPAPARGIAR
jgi:DNA-binding IclR family transcriptional regulator